MRIIPAAALILLILGQTSPIQGQDRYQREGFIANDAGQKCTFKQTVVEDSTYFQGSLVNTIGEIVFDDPQCMSDSGSGLDENKKRINQRISKWYSHKDARFDTANLYPTSMYQTTGLCMQSRTYPMIGVVLEYFIEDGSIVKVLHGPSLQGCKE